MSGSRPIGFIDYACGHSLPVSGSSGRTERVCQGCLDGYRPVVRTIVTPSTILGHKVSKENPNG